MKRTSKIIAALLILSLLLSACGGGPDGSSTPSSQSSTAQSSTAPGDSSDTKGGTATPRDLTRITYGTETEPGKIDPQNDQLIISFMIGKHIYDPLIDKDPATGEFIPCLATEWNWVDDTHLQLKLREGVKFHDGQDFTSADVLKTVERLIVGSATSSLYSAFDAENTVANGDYEVTIAFKTAYAPALNFLTNGRAYIVPHEYLAENGEDALNQNPVGTGAYKFVNWTIGSHMDLAINNDYWGEKAHIENITIRFITEDAARMVALETGELDMATALQDADISSIINGNSAEHLKGDLVPGLQNNFIGFNMDFEAFNDIRVRQAFAHAVDWPTAVEGAGGALFMLNDSCIAPTVQYYKGIGVYEYDAELAKQLLTDAGYPDGFSFSFNVLDNPPYVRMAEILQSYYAEVGLDMVITAVDTPTWLETNLKGTADTGVNNMTATTRDPAHTLNNSVITSALTVGKIYDEKYNELFEQSLSEMDSDKRGAIYAEIQQHVFDNVLQIPMFVRAISYGYWDYVEGFYPDPGQQVDMRRISFAL